MAGALAARAAFDAVAFDEVVAPGAAAGLVGTITTRRWTGGFGSALVGTVVAVAVVLVLLVVVRDLDRNVEVVTTGGADVVVLVGVVLVGVVLVGVVLVGVDDSRRRGADPDEVVKVKTSVSNRIGLDKITQWVLLKRWKGRMLLLAG